MKYVNIALSLALSASCFACSGPADQEEVPVGTLWYTQVPEWAKDIPVPGQEGRVDGSVWNDGMFQTEEARQEFCAEWSGTAEAWFCSEVGQLEQSWKSSEYHGMATDGWTCYGPESGDVTSDCLFPEMKHAQIIMTGTDCYDGPAPPDGPSLMQEEAILQGIKEGALYWDNLGGSYGTASDIVVSGTPGTDWYAPLRVTCSQDDPGTYADGGLFGDPKKRVNNLPVGPHSGKDLDDAFVIKEMWINVNIMKIWADAKNACGEAVTNSQLKQFARSVGVHEAGHTLGLSHFLKGGSMTNNVMYPWRSPNVCNQSWNILTDYQKAIGYLDTPSAGGVSVVDHGLQNEQPQ